MKKGYFLVFLTAIISGFSIFINKFGVGVVNPYIYTFLRVVTVAVLLTGLLLAKKKWRTFKKLTAKQWFLLVIIGFVGGSIPFLLFFKGLSLTSAAQGSFIHKTMFIYVALFAALFLKENIDKKFFLGGLIILIGNLILLQKFPIKLSRGDLLVFFATLLWSAENIISRYLLRGLEGKIVAWGRMVFGSLFILLFLLTTQNQQVFLVTELNLKQISWVLITAIFLFGYVLTWYTGLKYIPVSKATIILLLGSPITTLLSLISGGKVNFQEILSGILIIFGTVFVIGLKEIWHVIKETKNLLHVVRT